MLGVSPYITFQGNCREAIQFYKAALDATVVFVQTIGESPMAGMGAPDKIMHATIKVGNSMVMMSDDPTPDAGAGDGAVSGKISLAIGLNDKSLAERYFQNLTEGGSVILPLQKTFWAEAFGMVTDKFGVKWMVNCDEPK